MTSTPITDFIDFVRRVDLLLVGMRRSDLRAGDYLYTCAYFFMDSKSASDCAEGIVDAKEKCAHA